jgi:hypothetical protein
MTAVDCCVLNERQKQWLDEIEGEIQAKMAEAQDIVAFAQGYENLKDWKKKNQGGLYLALPRHWTRHGCEWPKDFAETQAASPMLRLEMATELVRTALRDAAGGIPFWAGGDLRQAYADGCDLPAHLERICEENYGARGEGKG